MKKVGDLPELGPIYQVPHDPKSIELAKQRGYTKSQVDPFYMIRREGIIDFMGMVDWHGPALIIALEAVRLRVTGKREKLRLSTEHLRSLGISKRQGQYACKHLKVLPHLFSVTQHGHGATEIEALPGALKLMQKGSSEITKR